MRFEGRLRKNNIDRWEISVGNERVELASGSVCELMIGEFWIRTRIEYDFERKDYVAMVPGICLQRGLRARIGEWR